MLSLTIYRQCTTTNSYYEKNLATGAVRCIDEEIPFDIPNGWEWERWGNISFSIQYGYNAPALEKGDIRMVRISDIQNGKVIWSKVPYCSIDSSDVNSYLLKPKDILFARTGGTVGKSFLVEEVPYESIYAGYLIRTQYSDELEPHYLKSFMESSLYWEQLKAGTVATAQPNCNGKTLGQMLIPIPPKSEQKRIIDKVVSVLPFLEKYEDLCEAFKHINEEIFNALKKSILQEAIQGKLVPQMESEGTAEELLDEIRTEKQRLVKEGKLKKSAISNESRIFRGDDNKYYEKIGDNVTCVDSDIPFTIPNSWCWCRFDTLFGISSARRVHEKDWRMEGIPFYRAREIGKLADSGYVENDLYIEQSLYDEFSTSGVPIPGDLMITAVGTLGKVYIVPENHIFYYKDGSVLCLSNLHNLIPEYVKMFIDSQSFIQQYQADSDGTTVATLTMVRLKQYLIPLPPIVEQKRIVEYVNSFMDILSK